ncbi:NUDIX domain-containing protein [Methylocaldum sp.]|uniref:NUDIX domain-containing protein n=1 Tax=Methylocaldum sp. TaxID=1969727 RepID=UPI002D2DB9C2|nr:NUDIX domain-containing protein [Methylocaldum sp.]HYE35290.1 NUDIX domain-containing protein [Methylocaldum sp.]
MKLENSEALLFDDLDLRPGPYDAFRFCPRCGGEYLSMQEHRAIKCGRCGFLYFFNTCAAAGAFVFYQNQLVLCVRAKDPAKGKLDLPGGFIEFNETVEDALRREIAEELNLETINYRYLTSVPNDYLYGGMLYKVTDMVFLCDALHIGTLKAADDVADYRLVSPYDIDPEELAFNSTRTALEKLLILLDQT